MPENDLATPEQRHALAQRLIAELVEKQPTFHPLTQIKAAIPRERFMLFAPPLVRVILEGRKFITRRLVIPQPISGKPIGLCPMGIPGDRLWVREKWGYRNQFFDRAAPAHGPYVYAADEAPKGARFFPWKPSLHMPRAASRIMLEIKAVRSERVADISPREALAEGCPSERSNDPILWFREVWDRFSVDRGMGWSANPWVWVIEFERTTVKGR